MYTRFADSDGGGTARTIAEAVRAGQPHWIVLAEDFDCTNPVSVASWIRKEGVRILNVARMRASKAPRVEGFVTGHLAEVI